MENHLRQLIRHVLAEQTYATSRGNSVKYGSNAHVKDLERSLDDLLRIRNRSPRTSKERYIYARSVEALRKEIKKARKFGLKHNLIRESNIRGLIQTILEGGLKAPDLTGGTILNPPTVAEAVKVYMQILVLWNRWLTKKGLEPVKPVGPVGSVTRYKEDITAYPDATYGDVDFMVALPTSIPEGASVSEIRNIENQTSRKYTNEMVEFLSASQDVKSLVNVPATLRSSPMMLIVKLSSGDHVQVDTVISYTQYIASPEGEGWSPWAAERGIKTYSIAMLHTTLAKILNLSIGDRGVLAKLRDGQPVPFAQRKNTELVRVGSNFKTLFVDIAKFLTGSDEFHPMLVQNPGVNVKNMTIEDEARGIKGLFLTLEQHGIVDNIRSALDKFHMSYIDNMQKLIEKKRKRGLTQDVYLKLQKQNQVVADRVKKVFDE